MNATLTSTEVMRHLRVSRSYIWKEIRAGRLPATLDTAVYPPVYRIPVAAVRTLRPAHRRWTDDEDERLVAMLGRVPPHAIAKRLGRTETAVRVRMKRLGHSQRSEHYTANVAAHELGMGVHSILHAISTGALRPLPYRPVWGANRCHMIPHEEIERFIRDRIERPCPKQQWRWERMPDGWFRSFATAVAKGEG
jgi:DNA-binding Lrp family transcriptional regulator